MQKRSNQSDTNSPVLKTAAEKNAGKSPNGPAKKESAKEISKPREQTRRNFLQCLGIGAAAVASPALLQGCYETNVYNLDFFHNFDPNNYAKLKPDQLKQWSDKTAYNKEDIPLALNQCLEEEFKIKFDVEGLYDFDFKDDQATLSPKPLGQQEVVSYLADQGVDVKFLSFESDGSLIIQDRSGNTFSMHQSLTLITIKGSTTGGVEKVLSINRGNSGKGVICSSGKYLYDNKGRTDFIITKLKVISPEHEIGTYDFENGLAFQKNSDSSPYSIMDKKGFMEFLEEAESVQECDAVLNQEKILPGYGKTIYKCKNQLPLRGIESIEELIKIIGKLPKDPKTFTGFIETGIEYASKDLTKQDDYKHPLETLKSGWADCDDFAVLNYFWAYLHDYKPEFVVISTGENSSHAFIAYQNEKNQMVFMDNTIVTILEPPATTGDYINKKWPGSTVVN